MIFRIAWPLLITGVFMTACNDPHKKPGKVANAFFEHLEDGEFQRVQNLCTKNGKAEIAQLEQDLNAFDISLPDTFFVFQVPVNSTKDTVIIEYAVDSLTIAQPFQLRLLSSSANRWFVDYKRRDAIGVARYFLSNFYAGQFNEARQFVTESSVMDLEYIKEIYQGWEGPEISITGVGFNEARDKAMVMYQEGVDPSEKQLNLRRVDGHWKVAMSKSTTW